MNFLATLSGGISDKNCEIQENVVQILDIDMCQMDPHMDVLFCGEGETIRRAFGDLTLLRDERVLHNLLFMEDKYLPVSDYFKVVQTEIRPFMRKIVAAWMLEVYKLWIFSLCDIDPDLTEVFICLLHRSRELVNQ